MRIIICWVELCEIAKGIVKVLALGSEELASSLSSAPGWGWSLPFMNLVSSSLPCLSHRLGKGFAS